MFNRPRIKLKLSAFDKTLELTGYIVLFGLWGLTIFSFINMPGIIPIHFGPSGEPNNYGEKTTILILPAIATLLFWGLTKLNKHPDIFNYSVSITKSNAAQQYKYATRLIRFLKLAIVVIFFIIVLFTYLTSIAVTDGLGDWFLPFVFSATLIPTGYYITKSLSAKQDFKN